MKIDNDFIRDNREEIFTLMSLEYFKVKSKKDFVSLLSNSNEQMLMFILSKLDNSISISENKMLTYLNVKSSNQVSLLFDRFAVLVSQNCKSVDAGDTIEISAGVGAFSLASSPKITIDGSNVKVGKDGVAKYIFKATGEKGINIMPVYIEFIAPDGTKQNSKVPVIYYIN